MKKVLLFACLAFAAVSVNAQQLNSVSNSVVMAKQYKSIFAEKVTMSSAVKASVKDMGALKAQMAVSAKAPAAADLNGDYIEDRYDEIHTCTPVKIETAEVNGKTMALLTICNGYAEVVGEYNAETGLIECGAQVCYNHETYGKFEIYSVTEEGNLGEELSFQVNDDKTISVVQTDYVIIMADYSEQEGKLQIWDFGWEANIYPMNAIQIGYENSSNTGKKWAVTKYPLYVEDYETAVDVYGFCGMGLVSMEIAEDLSVSMATGQPLDQLASSQDPDGVYGTLNVVGVLVGEPNSQGDRPIQMDWDIKEVKGVLDADTISFANDYGMFAVATKPDAEENLYSRGWFQNATVAMLDGHFITGIKDVNVALEEKGKNSKTYNMMGQQVNAATAKGLLIRNGKKFIKK